MTMKLSDLNDTKYIKQLQKEMENPPQGVMSKEISEDDQKALDKAKAANIDELFKGMKRKLDPTPQNFLENVTYPRQASIIEYDLTPESQGNVGSCTSQAVCGTIQNKYARKTGQKKNFAESYLWWRQEEKPNTWISAKTAEKYWMVVSDYWGYYAKEGKPGWQDNKVATGKNARELSNLEQMKEEIAAGNPVIFSFSANFNGFAPNGYVDPKKATVNGAHAVQISAYNDDTQTFTCRNSWGNFGANGYLIFPYRYVTEGNFGVNFLCFERDILIKDGAPPAPTPTPPKPISYDVRTECRLVKKFQRDGKNYFQYDYKLVGQGLEFIKSWEEMPDLAQWKFGREDKEQRAVDMSKEAKQYINTYADNANFWTPGHIKIVFVDGKPVEIPLTFPKA